MLKKRKLIGFAGRKRSGKSALCKHLKIEENAVIVTIANHIKYLCCDLLQMSYDDMLVKKDNGYTFSVKADEDWYLLLNKKTGIDINVLKKELEGIEFTNVRQVLQVLGTDIIRKYDPNWHIRQTMEEIESYPEDRLIVVDDVRFPNEVKMIEDAGGEVFFVLRPYCREVSNHISETSLRWQDFTPDRILINNNKEEYFKVHFMAHYRNNFHETHEGSILLSENIHYIENSDFGVERETSDVFFEDVLRQVKNSDLFLDYGLIKYKTCQNDFSDQYLSRVDRHWKTIAKNNRCNEFITDNPLIVENLKKYL